jgi:adenylosuccinate lyase
MANLAMSGNPRYQPKDLVEIFGYDNLARVLVEVELAALDTLAEAGVIRQEERALLTGDIEQKLLAITTTEMDRVERQDTEYGKKTGHDIRALVRLMQEVLPKPLRRWVHVPLTSYDVIDTARAVQFARAYQYVVRPKLAYIVSILKLQALRHADTVQIGRTHGQHALPITVGFWFATILSRVLYNATEMHRYAGGLVGKISGAVGAYNAQTGLGITGRNGVVFEDRVLEHLNLKPAPISTQILPPEPLAYYLFSVLGLSASFGQLGRDARHLMRTEIGELAEPFEKGQVGSSTMAHKRNPLNFENLDGTFEKKSVPEFLKVLLTLISEHQRDLTGSSPMRDFPTIIINLVSQMDVLLRKDKDGREFLARLTVSEEACRRNLTMQGDIILAEPLYLALQMYGYPGDAHEVINHQAMPRVGINARSLYEAVEQVTHLDEELEAAWKNIPRDLHSLFREPHNYVGLARQKVRETCERADAYLAS